MKDDLEQRAEELALYLIENRATVRAAAQKFGISKSTVHTAVVTLNGFCGWLNKEKSAESDQEQTVGSDFVKSLPTVSFICKNFFNYLSIFSNYLSIFSNLLLKGMEKYANITANICTLAESSRFAAPAA